MNAIRYANSWELASKNKKECDLGKDFGAKEGNYSYEISTIEAILIELGIAKIVYMKLVIFRSMILNGKR